MKKNSFNENDDVLTRVLKRRSYNFGRKKFLYRRPPITTKPVSNNLNNVTRDDINLLFQQVNSEIDSVLSFARAHASSDAFPNGSTFHNPKISLDNTKQNERKEIFAAATLNEEDFTKASPVSKVVSNFSKIKVPSFEKPEVQGPISGEVSFKNDLSSSNINCPFTVKNNIAKKKLNSQKTSGHDKTFSYPDKTSSGSDNKESLQILSKEQVSRNCKVKDSTNVGVSCSNCCANSTGEPKIEKDKDKKIFNEPGLASDVFSKAFQNPFFECQYEGFEFYEKEGNFDENSVIGKLFKGIDLASNCTNDGISGVDGTANSEKSCYKGGLSTTNINDTVNESSSDVFLNNPDVISKSKTTNYSQETADYLSTVYIPADLICQEKDQLDSCKIDNQFKSDQSSNLNQQQFSDSVCDSPKSRPECFDSSFASDNTQQSTLTTGVNDGFESSRESTVTEAKTITQKTNHQQPVEKNHEQLLSKDECSGSKFVQVSPDISNSDYLSDSTISSHEQLSDHKDVDSNKHLSKDVQENVQIVNLSENQPSRDQASSISETKEEVLVKESRPDQTKEVDESISQKKEEEKEKEEEEPFYYQYVDNPDYGYWDSKGDWVWTGYFDDDRVWVPDIIESDGSDKASESDDADEIMELFDLGDDEIVEKKAGKRRK